tara:strand:- start:327 stop:701 length:375 start_codon:yes stop_codon:yes gene_type:complete
MRVFKILFLLSIFFVSGCEQVENTEEYLFDTWDLDWKQCGVYQNKYDAKLTFTQDDSIAHGWFLEQGKDSVKFTVEIINSDEILLSESTDSVWEGTLRIKEISIGLLIFEKEVQECEKELYRFE